jgi:hypothetical protein
MQTISFRGLISAENVPLTAGKFGDAGVVSPSAGFVINMSSFGSLPASPDRPTASISVK